jgi:hypothetical protein
MTTADMAAFAGRLGLDVLCLLVLIGVLYRRRAAGPEMALVFTALNIGLFAAVSVIGTGDFPTGVGFGLFGLLSLVRLRSAAFTLKDVAYTFAALVLALVNALPGRELLAVVALDVLILAALWVTDESRKATPTRVMRLTLDRAVTDPEDVRVDLDSRFSGRVVGFVVDDVDYVRETTRVSVRYELADGSWPWRDAQLAAELADVQEDPR